MGKRKAGINCDIPISDRIDLSMPVGINSVYPPSDCANSLAHDRDLAYRQAGKLRHSDYFIDVDIKYFCPYGQKYLICNEAKFFMPGAGVELQGISSTRS